MSGWRWCGELPRGQPPHLGVLPGKVKDVTCFEIDSRGRPLPHHTFTLQSSIQFPTSCTSLTASDDAAMSPMTSNTRRSRPPDAASQGHLNLKFSAMTPPAPAASCRVTRARPICYHCDFFNHPPRPMTLHGRHSGCRVASLLAAPVHQCGICTPHRHLAVSRGGLGRPPAAFDRAEQESQD